MKLMITDNVTGLARIFQAQGMNIGDLITLLAVIVALGLGLASLRQTQMLQKRERTERLLNEIIKWAIDVSQCEFMTDVSDLREISSKYIGTEQEGDTKQKDSNFKKELEAAMIVDYGNILVRYRAFQVRNLYILDVADVFGGGLKKATDLLCVHVQAHTILLKKLQDQYDKLHEERVDKHSPYLERYALDVTKEVIKLKRKG